MKKMPVGLAVLFVTGLAVMTATAQRAGRQRPTEQEALARPPLAKSEAEKNILSILDDLQRNQRRGMMNISVADGRLLRVLTESIGAKHVVELGTSNGSSGIS